MRFLIQIINGEIVHDFAFTLIETIKFNNWYHNNSYIEFLKCDINDISPKHKDYCPIGSVEFVHVFYKKLYNIDNIKPLNVPFELINVTFSKRNIKNYDSNDLIQDRILNDFGNSPLFVKSTDTIKYSKNGLYKRIDDIKDFGLENIQVSEFIEILSEYRCFIYENNLVGLQYYSGDFKIFPNIKKIESMIMEYSKSAPVSYTLDVGINNDDTFVIECHNFYSCGLYGFNDSRLPFMFWRWHKNFLKENIYESNCIK